MFAQEPSQPPKPFARIQSVVLDVVGNTIFLPGGTAVRLEPKTSHLLAVLAANANRVLRRGDLIDAIWGLESVGDEALSRQISLLRKLAGTQVDQIGELETIRKSGYRLHAHVEWLDQFEVEPPPLHDPSREPTWNSDPINESRENPPVEALDSPSDAERTASRLVEGSALSAAEERTASSAVDADSTPRRGIDWSTIRFGGMSLAGLTLVGVSAILLLRGTQPQVSSDASGGELESAAASSWLLDPDVTRLTASKAIETYPDLAPSGGSVVFARLGDGENSIVLQAIESREERVLASGEARHYFPRFSRDGGRVGFLRTDSTACGVYAVAITGGRLKRLAKCIAGSSTAFEWDMSGTSIFLTEGIQRDGGWSIVRVDIASGAVTPITHPDAGSRDSFPRLSADGGRLYFARGGAGADTARLWAQDLETGQTTLLTQEPRYITGLSAVGDYVVYSDGERLALVSTKGGEMPSRVDESGIFPSGRLVDGKIRLAYSTFNYASSLYTTSLPGHTDSNPTLRPLLSSDANDEDPVFLPDLQRVLFVSDRAGGYDVWLGEVGSGETFRLTTLAAAHLEDLAISSDGSLATVTESHSNGNRFRLWLLDLHDLDRVTTRPIGGLLQDAMAGQFSADANRVFFAGRNIEEKWAIYSSSIEDLDQSQRVSPYGPNVPHALANGRLLATTAGAAGVLEVTDTRDSLRPLPIDVPVGEIAVSDNWLLYAPNALRDGSPRQSLCLSNLSNPEPNSGAVTCSPVHAPDVLRIIGLDFSRPDDLGGTQVILSAIDETRADVWVGTIRLNEPQR